MDVQWPVDKTARAGQASKGGIMQKWEASVEERLLSAQQAMLQRIATSKAKPAAASPPSRHDPSTQLSASDRFSV